MSRRRAFLQSTVLGGYNFEQALEFDGVDDYVVLPSTFSSTQMTFSFWFKIDTFASINCVIGNSIEIAQYVRFDNSTTINVRANGSGGNATFNFPALSTGVWYNCFFSTDGLNGRLFINGVESTSGTVSTSNRTFIYNSLGAQAISASFFNGVLDDVLLYNVVSADPLADASAIYNAGSGVDPLTVIPSALQLYRFNNNANNDGSLGGSATLNNFIADPYVTH